MNGVLKNKAKAKGCKEQVIAFLPFKDQRHGADILKEIIKEKYILVFNFGYFRCFSNCFFKRIREIVGN
jgi:hypothetical protein